MKHTIISFILFLAFSNAKTEINEVLSPSINNKSFSFEFYFEDSLNTKDKILRFKKLGDNDWVNNSFSSKLIGPNFDVKSNRLSNSAKYIIQIIDTISGDIIWQPSTYISAGPRMKLGAYKAEVNKSEECTIMVSLPIADDIIITNLDELEQFGYVKFKLFALDGTLAIDNIDNFNNSKLSSGVYILTSRSVISGNIIITKVIKI
jgi:hypothetical protein